MMFSSNQELKVSGDLRDIEYLKLSLDFGLTISGLKDCLLRKDKPLSLIYQITPDGKYCIGGAYKDNLREGWQLFPFDYDLDILSRVIKQHLEKIDNNDSYGYGDGSTDKGFLMSRCPNSYSDEEDGIKTPWFGDLVFKPFTCYYAK